MEIHTKTVSLAVAGWASVETGPEGIDFRPVWQTRRGTYSHVPARWQCAEAGIDHIY